MCMCMWVCVCVYKHKRSQGKRVWGAGKLRNEGVGYIHTCKYREAGRGKYVVCLCLNAGRLEKEGMRHSHSSVHVSTERPEKEGACIQGQGGLEKEVAGGCMCVCK